MRSRRQQVGVSAATVSTVAALLLAVVHAPSAAGAPAAPPGAADTGPSTNAAPVSSATVTLLTGDVVRVDTDSTGRQSVAVVPDGNEPRQNIKVVQSRGDLYAVPQRALPYLDSQLDRQLFNVSSLIRQGYDDAHRSSLPLLVTYPRGAGQPGAKSTAGTPTAHPSLPGTTRTATLESINGVALRATKSSISTLWESLDSGQSTSAPAGERTSAAPSGTLAGGVGKIWLDGRVKADLAESVPQIGAPAAWAAGLDGRGVTVAVLDTGYDRNHPDLAGRVSGEQDFTGSGTTQDHQGHGTHVAATVGGSGAGPKGARGVAPGANLMIGKVLGDDGTGADSWLIDGMEWATSNGADIVSMSLSAETSDGSDPMSQAVDALTASTGTLFVAAAGNTGPGEQTVRNPGAADSALAVGAVDKSDVLADFSSRGPRLNNYAIKPDITAPGVDIIAARAAGTSLGTPVDENHTSLSGTSMATPHVAGAAAILAQQHPDWSATELKAALVSTATPNSTNSVYEQGGGRVDVRRATEQQVYATPASLSLGTFDWPHDGTDAPVARTITYTNPTDNAVALALSTQVSGRDGAVPPAGMFGFDANQVTVPAHGSTSVTLTLDPNLGDTDLYGGYVVATGDGVTVHTPVGLFKEPRMVDLTIDAVTHAGQPAGGGSSVDLWNLDTDDWKTDIFGGKGGSTRPAHFRVRPGTYSLMGFLFTQGGPRDETEVALVGQPELVVTDDTRIVLDGRTANQIVVDTQKPAEHQGLTVSYYRRSETQNFNLSYLLDQWIDTAYAAPTVQPKRGYFETSSQWEMFAPQRRLAIQDEGSRGVLTSAEYTVGSPKLDGRHALTLVSVPDAAALSTSDVHNRTVLLPNSPERSVDEQVRAAADAGAQAAIIYNDIPGRLIDAVGSDSPIPSFTLSEADGQRLLGRLGAARSVQLEFTGTAVSPYLYDLDLPVPNRIPANLTFPIRPSNTAQLDVDYHAAAPHKGAETRYAFRPHDTTALRIPRKIPLPLHRTEWVSANDTTWRQTVWADSELEGLLSEPLTRYTGGTKKQQSWFRSVIRPGVPDNVETYGHFGLPGYRTDDTFTILMREFLDADGHYSESTGNSRAQLFRDGTLVAERNGMLGDWPASADPANYRLDLDVNRAAPWWTASTSTHTSWTFASRRPAAGERAMLPLLQVDYDVPVDRLDQVSAKGTYSVDLDVHRQAHVGRSTIASVAVWVSADDGRTWQQSTVRTNGKGRFTVNLHPADRGKWVSLRVLARDTDGNTIDQTVTRAYRIATN